LLYDTNYHENTNYNELYNQKVINLTFNVQCCVVLSNGRQPSEGSLPGWLGDCAAVPAGSVSEVDSVSSSSKRLTQPCILAYLHDGYKM
jgi:hypothetical protein